MPRDKDKKSNIAIWKIDKTIELFNNKNAEEIIESIKAFYTKRQLEEVPLATVEYEGKNIKILQKVRYSEGWSKFLDKVLSEDISSQKKEDLFSNANKDLVLFIYDEKDIFAITSGGGYHIIQGFIDERFPFEVAKRMLTGDFKSAEMRDLTGTVYSQSRNFRRSYSFSRRESFGKVWKKLTGNIDTSILENSQYVTDFIEAGKRKKFNADIKSSFTFRKSVTIDQVIAVIKEIQRLLETEPTEHQKETFRFLDTLKEVTSKKTKENLKDALVKKIYEFVISDSQECDFDFCHPKEITKFLHGTDFKISNHIAWPDETPSASEVLIKLRHADNGFIDKGNFTNFKERFLHLVMQFREDDAEEPIGDSLWKYFHGEIVLGDKKYFFIDGRWYEIVGEFLKRLSEDFQELVFSDKGFLTTEIPFINWAVGSESAYNTAQGEVEDFYFGDEVFLKRSDKGKIELFDLMYVKDKKTYLIQVKDKFGASIRDACSQIQIAAEIIENNIGSNISEELDSYYIEFAKKNTGFTKSKFLRLLKQERCYVLAFATGDEFTKENFISDKFQSEIARFEVLGLSHDFKSHERQLKIANIKKRV